VLRIGYLDRAFREKAHGQAPRPHEALEDTAAGRRRDAELGGDLLAGPALATDELT
jgi:hypothetical protein